MRPTGKDLTRFEFERRSPVSAVIKASSSMLLKIPAALGSVWTKATERRAGRMARSLKHLGELDRNICWRGTRRSRNET